MRLQEVLDRLETLRTQVSQRTGDSEVWHIDLDQIYIDVLRAISLGQCEDYPPEDFAAEAIKGEDIKFSRWYA